MAKSLYRPEFDAQLIQHMSEGKSFMSFGAIAGVSRKTLYCWCEEHPSFGEAKQRGELASLAHWEGIGYAIVTGQVKSHGPAIYIFTMKARFRNYGYKEYLPGDLDIDAEAQDDLSGVSTENLLKFVKK